MAIERPTINPTTTGRVVVYHGGYGCDTGCCGHWVQLGDTERFSFDHPDVPDETPIEFARRMICDAYGDEHVADLDWDNSFIFEE